MRCCRTDASLMGLMQRHSTVRESLPTRPETRWAFPGREARQTRCVGRRWRPYRHEGTGPAARPRMTPHSCCWSRSTSWRPMGRSTSGTFLLGWPRHCQRCGCWPTTQAAVRRFVATGQLHATEGSSIGAAMRALPLGWATPVTAAARRRELTGRLSRTTHGAPEAIISACVVAEMAAWAIEQHPVDAVVAAGVREAEDLARQYAVHPATVQPLRRAASGDWPPTTAEPTLDALATVASVLHVLREKPKDLATALKRAVALGGDTDTTAAIVGGILGCQLEDVERQIPWISRVGMPDARLIEATAAGLYELRRSSQ